MNDSNSDQPAAEEHAREERQAADGVIQKRSRLIVWLRRALLTGFIGSKQPLSCGMPAKWIS